MQSITTRTKKNDNVWFSNSATPQIVSQNNRGYRYREMNIDRRMEDRLAVSEGIYAVIASFAPQICQIRDMGEGGMSYEYFTDDEPVSESKTLDIIVTGFGFCLEQIPFKKVDDYKLTQENTSRFEKRVACIEFIYLSDDQKMMIRNFITNHIGKTVN